MSVVDIRTSISSSTTRITTGLRGCNGYRPPRARNAPSALHRWRGFSVAHHWGRELIKLGHTVKLMPPAYVKPYVKRGKTDAADAEAIAEAVTRPTMRFVAVKSMDQQAVLMLHKVRDLLVRQRTMLINAFGATWPSSGS